MHAGRSHYEIPHSYQTEESERACPHPRAQAGDLLQTTCNERRLCIIPKIETVKDTDSKSDDVFQCSAYLDACHIIISVDPEVFIHENILHNLQAFRISACGAVCCRSFQCNLFSMARSAQDTGVCHGPGGHLCCNDIGYPHVGSKLQAFCHMDDYHFFAEFRKYSVQFI